MMSGCGSLMTAPQIDRMMPESLMVRCSEQIKAEDGKLSTILRVSIERSEQYAECEGRHRALADWVRGAK